MAKSVSRSLALVRTKRASKALAAHNEAIDADLVMGLDELDARGTLVTQELGLNAAVISSAAANEMAVADKMIQRAGGSRVAQTIAADRINRLIQTNDRTLGRNGF